ncbi:MAG TPA: hypothetical protein VFA07_07940 [Chthonomonadaceae bacterium]|nr:hypothetical protein [Chthonomonadaceae bacterium]
MQNDDRTVGSILSRRQALGIVGVAGLALLTGHGGVEPASASAMGLGASGVVVTPAEEEGPFFVNVGLHRSDLTANTKNPNVLHGLPLTLKLKVYQVNGSKVTPLSGAHVDIWHADAEGVYSDEPMEGTEGETFLRGYQVTDAGGAVQLKTIYPGWYPGRTAHVHFKVRTYSASGKKTYEFTSQLYMDDKITDIVYADAPYNRRGPRPTRNADDGVYNTETSNGTASGSQLLLNLTKASSGKGYVGIFTIGLQMN